MRPIRRATPLSLALAFAFAAGATGACSSSSNSPADGGGGHGGGGGGTGGGAGGADAAAGGAGGQNDGAAAADLLSPDSAMSMTTTSGALTAGGTFADANTCAGANTSPDLTWTAGPSGTMSYAVALIDTNIGVAHWVAWDIPSATMTLAAALPDTATLTAPAGAKQTHFHQFFGTTTFGYRGPCPSGANHTYRFEVHAVNVATLPTVTTASDTPAVYDLVVQHSLAHGDLTGTSNASRPPADAAAGQ